MSFFLFIEASSYSCLQALVDDGIIEGWRLITIDSEPFSDELFYEKEMGSKNYTIEFAEKVEHVVTSSISTANNHFFLNVFFLGKIILIVLNLIFVKNKKL